MKTWIFALLVVNLSVANAASPDAWPRWRGPFNTGVAIGDAPVEFSPTSKNMAWKIKLPGKGNSSPVLWGDRIYLTTAVPVSKPAATPEPSPAPPPPDAGGPRRRGPGGPGGPGGGAASGVEHKFMLLCLSRKDGHVIWERVARTAVPHEGYHFRYGSFASNNPVTDGKRVYAFFGSRGIFTYDMDGKLLWQKDFDPMRMRLGFGEGSAAVVEGDKLILNFDQEQNSHILVLDSATGKQLWRADRAEDSNWAAPLVVDYKGKKQVVTSAHLKVRSYDLETGKLMWECAGLGANVIPAPVTAGDFVYVMSGYRDPNLMAIRLDRTGDLTGTDAIIWQNKRGNSYTPSPVLADGKLYFVSDNGMLSCFDAKTGTAHYQQRLPKPYNLKSSLVAANGKLYVSTEEGDILVVKMGESFEVLAVNSFPDQSFIATPAVADGEMYLRSEDTLYCVRSAK